MIEATNPDLLAPGISTTGDYHPILTGVQVINTVSGFVMTSVIRQTYLNDGNETVEITYTFPLTSDTVLRDLSVEINGKICHSFERLAGDADSLIAEKSCHFQLLKKILDFLHVR